MEWGGWLADFLTRTAHELFTNGMHHLPSARDHHECLGDVLTHLYDPVGAAAGTTAWGLNHNTLAWQMLGKGLAHRFAPREGAYGACGVRSHDLLSRKDILRGGSLQFLKLQFQLVDQPSAAFGRDAAMETSMVPCTPGKIRQSCA